MITFTLPEPTKTLNEIRSMHFRVYAKYRRQLAFSVYVRTLKQKPAEPYARARIIIERHSAGQVDEDGLYGGFKPLLDVLQPFHSRLRPDAIGILASDAPDCLTIEARQIRCPRGQGKTIVEIHEVTE